MSDLTFHDQTLGNPGLEKLRTERTSPEYSLFILKTTDARKER